MISDKKAQVAATAPLQSEPAKDEEKEFWEAHDELAALEGSSPNETADLTMVQAFGAPKEWRTMGKVHPRLVPRLAAIHAKGLYTGSRLRISLVENIMLMSRSGEAFGSEQMVRVAQSRHGPTPQPQKRGWLASWFQPRQGGPQ